MTYAIYVQDPHLTEENVRFYGGGENIFQAYIHNAGSTNQINNLINTDSSFSYALKLKITESSETPYFDLYEQLKNCKNLERVYKSCNIAY